jgi:hypothetical protein
MQDIELSSPSNIEPFRVLAATNIDKSLLRQYLALICDWERIEYGENKHRIPSQLNDWLHVNGEGFLCCVNNEGKLFGYADLWAIENNLYDQLKTGFILEEAVPCSALLSSSQTGTAINWYIGSIITDPQLRNYSPNISRDAFRAIRYAIGDFFEKLPQYPAEVLAVGSSKKGRDLLTRWDFKPVKMMINAPDSRPRYILQLSNANDALSFRN